MRDGFSTRKGRTIFCPRPVLEVGFPRTGAGRPGTVVLANGAVVDRAELGAIVSKFCPAFICPTPVISR